MTMKQLSWRFFAALATILAIAAILPAQEQKEDEGEIIGKVWELSVRKRDGAIEKRRISATPDGKVRGRNAQEIGTWTQDGIDVTMRLRYGRDDPWNGVYKLTQVRKDPPSWKGVVRYPNGRELAIPEVKLLQD